MVHVVESQKGAQLVFVGDVHKHFEHFESGTKGICLQEFRQVRGDADLTAVDEQRVLFVQVKALCIRQAQVDELPLVHEVRGDVRVTYHIFHYEATLNMIRPCQ